MNILTLLLLLAPIYNVGPDVVPAVEPKIDWPTTTAKEPEWTAFLASGLAAQKSPHYFLLMGEPEYELFDETRADIYSSVVPYVFEVEWAPKWKEAVGQALFYSVMTDRKPGIVILTKDRRGDKINIHRLKQVVQKHGILLIIIDVKNPENKY